MISRLHLRYFAGIFIVTGSNAFLGPSVEFRRPNQGLVELGASWTSTTHGGISALYSPPTSSNSYGQDQEQHIRLQQEVLMYDDHASQHFHEFWGQEQSSEAIEAHIQACLTHVDAMQPTAAMPMQQQPPRVQVISNEPPLVVIHNFLSTDMCHQIMQAAQDSGELKRSTTGTHKRTSGSRTSSTVWLRDEQCPNPLRVLAEKTSLICGLPPSHMENLQVCRYEQGQKFNLHTDHQESFNDLDCRGRLATCLIYLEEPDNGGETWFPDVLKDQENNNHHHNVEDEVLVPAQQGSAVLFWNTLERPGHPNYNPLMDLSVDPRLLHAGLPVKAGEKWICNRWIHPIDFDSGVMGLRDQPRTAMV